MISTPPTLVSPIFPAHPARRRDPAVPPGAPRVSLRLLRGDRAFPEGAIELVYATESEVPERGGAPRWLATENPRSPSTASSVWPVRLDRRASVVVLADVDSPRGGSAARDRLHGLRRWMRARHGEREDRRTGAGHDRRDARRPQPADQVGRLRHDARAAGLMQEGLGPVHEQAGFAGQRRD